MKTTIRSLFFLLAATISLQAAILTVDNNPGAVAMFDNFEDTYEAADNGDTILLAGSSIGYGGTYNIYKRLKIVGPGYRLSENSTPGISDKVATISLRLQSDNLLGNASGSELVGLTLRPVTVSSGLSNIVVKKCWVPFTTSFSERWIFSSPVVLTQVFYDTSFNISFENGSQGSIVTNSICRGIELKTPTISIDRSILTSGFNGNPSTSISNSIFVFSSSFSFTRNSSSVSNCMAIGFDTLPAGAGNINGQLVGNVFLNTGSEDAKWRLKAGSPAIGAGTGGSDMGAFGGTNPYVLSGVPGIPRLTRLAVPATATSTSGLQFEVDAQAFPE